MFDIGSSLREAREKRGLELDAAQRALRIRRRYLEALESERFDQLPGEVYARGFLREYADFLGLDGSLYVEEYNARHAAREPQVIAAQPSVPRQPRSARLGLVLLVLVLVAVVGALVAWRLTARYTSQPSARTATSAPPPPASRAAQTTTRTGTAPTTVQQLTLTAARGDCWVGIRVGSPNGPRLYWQTLRQGNTIHFPLRRALWVRVGRGGNLDVTLGGKPVTDVPAVTGELTISQPS